MTTMLDTPTATDMPTVPPLPVKGDRVICWATSGTVTYAGPSDDGGTWLSYSSHGWEYAGPVWHVAPAGTPIPAKDPRAVATKSTREAEGFPYGPKVRWALELPGGYRTSYATKGEATATGLRRLAILDWHAARNAAEV